MVSEKKNGAEITDAEKQELVMKVFPRLRKRARLIRFFRMSSVLAALVLMVSCTAAVAPEHEKKLKEQMISTQIKKGSPKVRNHLISKMRCLNLILPSLLLYVLQKNPQSKRSLPV